MKEYQVIKNFFWNSFYKEGESIWLYDKDAEMLIYLGFVEPIKFNNHNYMTKPVKNLKTK